MHFRNAFALAPISYALLGLSAPSVALGDTPKEACLMAADQGQSLRDEGKYALARDQFQACAREACPKLVHDQCTEWLRQLDESMPTVVFGAKDDQGGDVATARVLVDGKAVTTGIDGKPVSLDPGAHEVRFERDAPGQSVALHVVLRTGEKNRDVTGTFPAPEVAAPAPESPPAAPSTPPAPPPEAREEGQASNGGRNAVSISLLGAGVVGIGLGAFFGLQSQSEKSDAARLRSGVAPTLCLAPTPSVMTTCQELSDKVDAQNRDALVSDILYVAGGVFAAGAVATFLLWPNTASDTRAATSWVAPFVEPTGAGVRVGGTF